MSYKVKLDVFQGPLDLLLHLIGKNEIDIYDIPVSTITEQYLEYLELMRTLNLDIAGEFLVMASTLMYIKSKMLLPPSEYTDEEEEEDPRAELVERLLEYKKFKEGAMWLNGQDLLGQKTFARSALIFDMEAKTQGIEEGPLPLENASIIELLEAFRTVLSKTSQHESLDISFSKLSIADRIQEVLEILKEKDSVEFNDFFVKPYNRSLVVITFVALLELIRLSMIKVYQTMPFGKIMIMLRDGGEENNE